MKNESNVNTYARVFPTTFQSAEGDILIDSTGKKYLDFFCGAGALNYGHNHPGMKQAITSFLESNAIVHCLDMNSVVKKNFLDKFNAVILKPRGLNYKVQFAGPTGTNAVEAAVKLARIATGRKKVVSFTQSFHGMTATSLALSGCLEDKHHVNPSQDIVVFPYDQFLGKDVDTAAYLEKMIATAGTGVGLPAAIIMETVQAEGGVNVASNKWLQDIRKFTRKHGILMIVDDIQVGCGRTGNFFSFERAGIVPDVVLLSKSISGFGLPLSLVLIKPEWDVWKPGEHNGTFRSNNLSLCTATEALEFWKTGDLERSMSAKTRLIGNTLHELKKNSHLIVDIRGIGLIWGIEFVNGEIADAIAGNLFNQGMLIETCGNDGQVIKLLPPLTISMKNLEIGLSKLADNITASAQQVASEENVLSL
jgi:diaminobutyrate-2-oxoglutarate transaminase